MLFVLASNGMDGCNNIGSDREGGEVGPVDNVAGGKIEYLVSIGDRS